MQAREAEHLVVGVMCLYQPVAVEQDALASLQGDLVLLIAHRRHKSQRHPPSPQFLGSATMPQVGQIVPSVGVGKMAALGVEDAIEAGDKRARGYVRDQRFVDPRQNLPRGLQSLNDGPKHAASRCHHQRRRHTMTGGVSYHQSQSSVRELQEVVEVSTDLPGWSVVGSYLPAIEFGCRLGQELLLDLAGDLQFVLDALSLLGFCCPKAPGQVADWGVEGRGALQIQTR